MKEKLKLLIISPEGEVSRIYVEDYPEITDTHHSGFLDRYIHKICKNRNLRKEAHPLGYFERLKLLQKYNYTVLLDATNYMNYHTGKVHDGFIHLPMKMSKETKEKLIELSPELFSYVTYIPDGFAVGYFGTIEHPEYQNIHSYPELLKELLEEKNISKEEEDSLTDLINYVNEEKNNWKTDKAEERLNLLKNKVLLQLSKRNRKKEEEKDLLP